MTFAISRALRRAASSAAVLAYVASGCSPRHAATTPERAVAAEPQVIAETQPAAAPELIRCGSYDNPCSLDALLIEG